MEEKTSKKANPFVRFGKWCADVGKWLVDIKDWKMIFRSIPSIVVGLFLVSILGMNLLANKFLLTGGQWISVTWGLLLSAIPFLICDIVTKTYGAKATIKLNILGLIVSLGMTLIFLFVSVMPEFGSFADFWHGDFTYGEIGFGEGGVMRASWYITLASSIAFIISGIVNAVVNAGVGKLFHKNPDSRVAFMTRSYSSTLIGQFVDNLLFIFLAFGIFGNIAAGWSNDVCVTNLTAGLGAGLIGAVVELLMEVFISPVGFKICKKWKKDSVGKDYLDYCHAMELKEDIGRFNFKEGE
jgi:uncharacterized PurR-regulated membrane protein YhhQ (DUF165 family)